MAGDCRAFLFPGGSTRFPVSPRMLARLLPGRRLPRPFDGDGDGFALVPPAGKIPVIRKSGTLSGLDLLDATIDPVQEDAFSVWLVDQRQTGPIEPQVGVFRYEVVQLHAQELRDPLQFVIRHGNFPMPATTIRATLTGVAHPFFHVVEAHGRYDDPDLPFVSEFDRFFIVGSGIGRFFLFCSGCFGLVEK